MGFAPTAVEVSENEDDCRQATRHRFAMITKPVADLAHRVLTCNASADVGLLLSYIWRSHNPEECSNESVKETPEMVGIEEA
jgi:hypothetical protein